MYYHCSNCKKKYKYELDLMAQYGSNFGKCPMCNSDGVYEKEGPRQPDDKAYEEIDS